MPQSPPQSPPESPTSSVFASSPPRSPSSPSSFPHSHQSQHNKAGHAPPSDLPFLRRTHLTDGYRTGVTAGKADPEVAQKGFDRGYPLGAELGVRVGRVIGALVGFGLMGTLDLSARMEGLGRAGGEGKIEEDVDKAGQVKEDTTRDGNHDRVDGDDLLTRARGELTLDRLLREIPSIASIASNDVDLGEHASEPESSGEVNEEEEDEIDFNAIPTLRKWEVVVDKLGKRHGVDFGSVARSSRDPKDVRVEAG